MRSLAPASSAASPSSAAAGAADAAPAPAARPPPPATCAFVAQLLGSDRDTSLLLAILAACASQGCAQAAGARGSAAERVLTRPLFQSHERHQRHRQVVSQERRQRGRAQPLAAESGHQGAAHDRGAQRAGHRGGVRREPRPGRFDSALTCRVQTCQHAENQKMPAPEIFCTLQARGRGVHRGSRCAPQTRAPHSACGRLDRPPPPPPAPPCCPLPPAAPSREAPAPEGCRPAARADARTRA